MDISHLTVWQRVHRRVSLLGGSYTHPDGFIELDFEGHAGIDGRNDSAAAQKAKLDAYHRRKAEEIRQAWTFLVGLLAGAALIHYWPSLWPF